MNIPMISHNISLSGVILNMFYLFGKKKTMAFQEDQLWDDIGLDVAAGAEVEFSGLTRVVVTKNISTKCWKISTRLKKFRTQASLKCINKTSGNRSNYTE